MKTYRFDKVELTSGYLFDKQELNRMRTIYAVYDRFDETGRIGAFNFDYVPAEDKKSPHVFWDSDVAKWMEGAAYIIKKHPSPDLEERIDALVEKIREHQDENGYFTTGIDPSSLSTCFPLDEKREQRYDMQKENG